MCLMSGSCLWVGVSWVGCVMLRLGYLVELGLV